jgi:hypothetical protein
MMRILLACLMCEILPISQAWAIDGGPGFGGGQVQTTGNYAGLFVPRGPDNSLGLFTTTIPRTGIGTGTLAMFRNGIFYPGTIQALADPDSAKLTGVASSSFDITFTSETSGNPPTTKNIVITFNANGSITATIRANPNTFSTAATRMRGKAKITYATVGSAPGFDDSSANSNGPIAYRVSGFKQSEVSQ